MSDDKPLETKTSVPPPAGAGYRTLTPAGAPKPAAAAPKPTSVPSDSGQAPAKPEPAQPERPAPEAAPGSAKDSRHPDPTRFGDWEVKGRCIDF